MTTLQHTDGEWSVRPARYAKKMMAILCPSDGTGYKTVAMVIAEKYKGRWSHREGGYIVSPTKAEKFKTEMLERAKVQNRHMEGMALALTLRARQGLDTVYIGDDIAVQLVSTRDGRVKLRFTAPPGVTIDRACVRAERQAEIARLLDDGGKCIENP